MIKVIVASATLFVDEEFVEFAQALATYAFEYGRYMLYKQEQALVNEYIEAQYKLDKELEEKYRLFISELETQAKQFYTYIENAFSVDFRNQLINSVTLAQAVGVEKTEILMTLDDIDSFLGD